jgi:exopolysaccharide biosynthesis WecB/TagA/CpsF family protein
MKGNVLGVLVDATTYDEAAAAVLDAARDSRPFALTALAVHGVMTGVQDPAHEARLNSFDLVTPDGQPVRWALNSLHGAGLTDRVYGPTLTLRVLAGAADAGLPVYLYGSTDATLDRLVPKLQEMFPALKIAGREPSKFRTAQPGEDERIADRIKSSGARLVLVGLGCPRQEVFAFAMRPLLPMPLLAVGAAFDYHAGQLRRPPSWMQGAGLEWLWRLGLEPGRLWKRYLLLNPNYLARLAAQKLGLWKATPAPPATERPATFSV